MENQADTIYRVPTKNLLLENEHLCNLTLP